MWRPKCYSRCLARRPRLQLFLTLVSVIVSFIILIQRFYAMDVGGEGGTALLVGSGGGAKSSVVCPEINALNRKQLFLLVHKTHKLLQQLQIVHFLCFTSLWSAAQESGPFPWEANAHFCALNSLGLGYDEPALLRVFRKSSLSLDYSSAEANYRVTNTSQPPDSPYVEVKDKFFSKKFLGIY